MAIFNYTASTPEGDIKTGTMIQNTKDDVAEALQSQGLYIVSISEEKLGAKKSLSFSLGKMKLGDLVMMVKQLAVMIRAGIDMQEAISILGAQSQSKHVRQVLAEVLKTVESGRTLSGAFAEHPRDFPDIMVNLIRAGELGGNLEENLERLAVQLERDYEVKKRIKDALIYPSIIVGTALLLLLVMSLFVLPKLVKLFESFNLELPITTRMVIWFSGFMQKYGIVVIIGVFLLAVAFSVISRLPKVKPYTHRLILSLPLIGKMSRSLNLARFARTLGTLLKSGIPIVEALHITSNTLDNYLYKEKVNIVAREAQKGIAISDILKANDGGVANFPPIVTRMAGVGEKTGKLEEVLLYVAQFYEEEVTSFTKNITTLIEPVLLIGIGLGVGGMVISIIYPIYQFTGSLGK